jgi:Mannosyl-glycoprotein endo-beta-N-acetylglucosaminidase
MSPASRPPWQRATALASIGASGIATGISFLPKTPADLTSPASVAPATLLALEHLNGPAPGSDAMLRAAIVHMARHFLRLADTRSPAEMEAMIWQYASTDGVDHGPSCAAFASLILELGSHIAGLDSWVSGGSSYPWPVHAWVDGRVDPNAASPGVVSVLQDAQSHGRWHPLGDGYMPQPGDWVLFDGHVEVVTKYHGGVLHTIGGDSLPNMSVNAHEYADPLRAQGVAGFVDNGVGMSRTAGAAAHAAGAHRERGSAIPGIPAHAPSAHRERASMIPGIPAPAAPHNARQPRDTQGSPGRPAHGAQPIAVTQQAGGTGASAPAAPGQQAVAGPQRSTGLVTPSAAPRTGQTGTHAERGRSVTADVPATGLRPARPARAGHGEAAIPGLLKKAHRHHPGDAGALPPYHRYDVPPSDSPLAGTAAQQAFINEVASGAMATQRQYGVPAAVTIAQAIDESGWGQSVLATNDHNLFGIKGTGPAGSDQLPTQEVINGQLVNLSSSFQVYQSVAQSIDAHGRLLARSGDYAGAMTQAHDPNAFAAALTGVYATDPGYGAKLIQLMQQYDLYRFDQAASRSDTSSAAGGVAHRGAQHAGSAGQAGAHQAGPKRTAGPALPQPGPIGRKTTPGREHPPRPRHPGPIGNPVPVPPAPIARPVPGQTPPVGNPVPMLPGTAAEPPGAAHEPHVAAAPARGGGVHAQHASSPSEPAYGQVQGAHDATARQPPATFYPGRSARPAPLAHPARPADLAGGSGQVPSNAADAGGKPSWARSSGGRQGALAGSRTSQAGAANGQPTGSVATRPSTKPGAGPSARPHAAASPAAAAGESQQGSAIIPGLEREGQMGNAAAVGSEGREGVAGNAAAASTPQGGSSIPGVQPAGTAGSAARTARPVRPSAVAGPAVGAPRAPAAPPAPRAADIPGAAAVPGNAAVPGAAAAAVHPRTVPGRAATVPAPTAAGQRPGSTSTASASARPGPAPGRPAPAPSAPVPAPGHLAPAPSAPVPAPGHPAPAPSAPVPAPGRPAPAPSAPVLAPGSSAPAPTAPVPAPGNRVPAHANPLRGPAGAATQGGADVPGLVQVPATAAASVRGIATAPANDGPPLADRPAGSAGTSVSPAASGPASAVATLTVYHAHMPPSVREAFVTSAKMPLVRAEPLYRDVASHTGIRWELLAACDWMQCKARQGYSPVYGEKLGTLNPDDTCYRTKSAALAQCASDLVQLARSVYGLDITTSQELTIRELANVFAAFRWGGLLKQHSTSAMDFPYSVAGLTPDHTRMRWPNIDDTNAPDKPGGRFRQPFGAVPVVLGLNYQALL